MINRPILMSLLGWILILLNSLAFLILLIFWDNPLMAAALAPGDAMPLGWYKSVALIGLAATVVAGIGILKGLDWSRYLFVGLQIGAPLLEYVTDSQTNMRPVSAVLVVAITIYLFRPAADEWFNQ